MNPIGLLLNGVTGVAKTYIERKTQIDAAKHEARLTELKIQSDVEGYKAQWEAKAADGMSSSWKDEYLIIVLTTPVWAVIYAVAFNQPELLDRVEHAMHALGMLPDWFQYLLYAGVLSSFGLKGVDKVMSMRNK